MAYAKSLDCHSPVLSWHQSTPQKVQSYVSELVLFVEKTRIHWLNFLSLKSELNFTFNSGGAQARNDFALMPSFTLWKMIPFKDTMGKCKLLLALQYFGEGKKTEDSTLIAVTPFEWQNPNICVPKATGVGVRTPREWVDWEGNNCCCLCISVHAFLFQKVYLLSCIWMHRVHSGPNYI